MRRRTRRTLTQYLVSEHYHARDWVSWEQRNPEAASAMGNSLSRDGLFPREANKHAKA